MASTRVEKRIAQFALGSLVSFGVLSALGWVIAADPALAAPRPVAEFDISYNSAGIPHLIVPVVISGEEYPFAVNTGSLRSTFDVRRRGLLTKHRFMAKLRRTKISDTYRAPAMLLGGMPLPTLDSVLSLDLSVFRDAGEMIDGVLGMDALGHFVLQLDFDRQKIVFLPTIPANAGKRIDLVAEYSTPVIVGVVNGLGRREFLLCTGGCVEGALNHNDFEALVARQQLVAVREIPIAAMFGKPATRFAILRAPFNVDENSHRDLIFEEDSGFNAPPHNSLGLDYLSRYCITFDFAHNAVYLKPGRSYSALQPLYGLLGVRVARHGERIVAQSVQKDSVTYRFVRPGDILESIDGHRVQSMPDVEVVARLSDRRAEIVLVWRRSSDNTTWSMPIPALGVKGND